MELKCSTSPSLQSLENVDLGQVVGMLRNGGGRADLEPAEETVFNHMLSTLDKGHWSLGLDRPDGCRDIPTPDYFSIQQLLCVVLQHYERFPAPLPHLLKEYDLQRPVPARLDFHTFAMLMLAQWAVQYDESDPPAVVKAMSRGPLECSRRHLLVEYSMLRQNCSRQVGEAAMLESEPAHAPWADPQPSRWEDKATVQSTNVVESRGALAVEFMEWHAKARAAHARLLGSQTS